MATAITGYCGFRANTRNTPLELEQSPQPAGDSEPSWTCWTCWTEYAASCKAAGAPEHVGFAEASRQYSRFVNDS